MFKFEPRAAGLEAAARRPALTLGVALESGSDERHFCKPTDVAVVSATGDFFVADGYCNARVLKFDRTGRLLKQWGRASASAASDAKAGLFAGSRTLSPRTLLSSSFRVLYMYIRVHSKVL